MEECHYCEGTDDEEEVYREIIECITGALDAKDAYTAGHSQRVSEMALKVCELIGLKKKGIRKIHIAAHLHDIGKIGIPDAILNKEGRLTDEEFEIMKKPGRGTHGHIAILTNNVDRAIYHLSQRGVKFDMDSKNVKDGKTIAIYFADEVAGFAIHLVQK